MKKLSIIILAIIQTLIFASCKSVTTDSDKLQVYTSFYAMYDFAKQIGGDKADVYLLCPSGQEPHDFEPTAQDIAKLSQSDVFIYNGMGMEHWTDSVTASLNGDVAIVKATDKIKLNKFTAGDPHVWLNPDNAYTQLRAIAEAYKSKDPANNDYYEKNLKECKEKIERLKQDLETAKNMFSSHSIVVSHYAYSHLCDVIDVSPYAVNGTDNSGDPTPQRMAEIENYIKDNNIKYIFTEPLGTSDIMKAIAKDTGCEILVLDPFEGSSENKDYFNVMYENIAALTQALN